MSPVHSLNNLAVVVWAFLSYQDSFDEEILKNSLDKSIIKVNFKDDIQIQNCDLLTLIIRKYDFKNNDVLLLNKYISIYGDKIIGWFYLEDKNILS